MVREHLGRGSYLTADPRAGQAFLHTKQLTSPVPMRPYRALKKAGEIERVNPEDATSPIAIYRHASSGQEPVLTQGDAELRVTLG